MKNLQMFPGLQMKMSTTRFLYQEMPSGNNETAVESGDKEKEQVLSVSKVEQEMLKKESVQLALSPEEIVKYKKLKDAIGDNPLKNILDHHEFKGILSDRITRYGLRRYIQDIMKDQNVKLNNLADVKNALLSLEEEPQKLIDEKETLIKERYNFQESIKEDGYHNSRLVARLLNKRGDYVNKENIKKHTKSLEDLAGLIKCNLKLISSQGKIDNFEDQNGGISAEERVNICKELHEVLNTMSLIE